MAQHRRTGRRRIRRTVVTPDAGGGGCVRWFRRVVAREERRYAGSFVDRFGDRLSLLRDSLPGQVLPGSTGHRYPVGELLGEGGQGWVFRGNWDQPNGHPVVLKILRPDATMKDALDRFQREAVVLRRISEQSAANPHVVRFFDHAVATVKVASTGVNWSVPYTVLEYVNGPTLEVLIRRTGGVGMRVDRAMRLIRHVVLGVQAVHAQNVVHRDLKPSNVLVDVSNGRELAKVTDFGLAKLADASLKKTTAVAGASLGYAPPEQYEPGNRRVGKTTDVFSLAAIVYEVLSGKPAFPIGEGEHLLLVMVRILTTGRPALARVTASSIRRLPAGPMSWRRWTSSSSAR